MTAPSIPALLGLDLEAHIRDLEAYFSGALDVAPDAVTSLETGDGLTLDERRAVALATLDTKHRVRRALDQCLGRRTVGVLRARYRPETWARDPELPKRFGPMVGVVVWVAMLNRRLTRHSIGAILARADKHPLDRDSICDLIGDAEAELELALLDYAASAPRAKRAA